MTPKDRPHEGRKIASAGIAGELNLHLHPVWEGSKSAPQSQALRSQRLAPATASPVPESAIGQVILPRFEESHENGAYFFARL
jgi:hypothetical protein